MVTNDHIRTYSMHTIFKMVGTLVVYGMICRILYHELLQLLINFCFYEIIVSMDITVSFNEPHYSVSECDSLVVVLVLSKPSTAKIAVKVTDADRTAG